MALRNVIGRNIRAELARAGLRQQDLADHLRLSQGAVSLKLNGRRPITSDELKSIAELLRVPAGVLLGDEPARSAS